MRRLTRRIGLFGGPGAMMPALDHKKSIPAAPQPRKGAEASPEPAAEPKPEPAKRSSWFGRLFGSKDD